MEVFVVMFHNRVALVSESGSDARGYAKELAANSPNVKFNQGDSWFEEEIVGTQAIIYVEKIVVGKREW